SPSRMQPGHGSTQFNLRWAGCIRATWKRSCFVPFMFPESTAITRPGSGSLNLNILAALAGALPR
ncbi:MAG: hypothetical protein Q7W53_01070, partial [Pseudomonadota bacterium]|nr:hypothetical protein [Pseudomonadota bacterium]MDP2351798.1 hypothetical protein [Pseudomonadota bacterium]